MLQHGYQSTCNKHHISPRWGWLFLIALLPSFGLFGQTQRPLNPFDLRHIAIDFSPSGARPMSMGGAGIALADDASATQLNPAGVALFNRPAFSFSTRFRKSQSEVPSPTATDLAKQDIFNRSQFDQVLLNVILNYKSLRIASYREIVADSRLSYKSTRPFSSDIPGRPPLNSNFPSREALLRLQIIDNTTSFAVRLGKRFNAGTTIRLTRFEYSLNELGFLPASVENSADQSWIDYPLSTQNLYFIRSADERQWGLGASFGVMAKLNSRMTGGFTYHYRPSFNITSLTRLPAFSTTINGDFTAYPAAQNIKRQRIRFDIPDSYGIGISYRYPGYFNAALDLTRYAYSQLLNLGSDKTILRNLLQNDIEDSASQPDLTLKDQWQLNIGMEYIFKVRVGQKRTRLPIRLGYYLDPAHQIYSRIEDSQLPLFQILYPKGEDTHHFSAGMGFFLGDLVRFDSAVRFSESILELMVTSTYTF